MPAALTSASMRPPCAATVRNALLMASSSERSQATALTPCGAVPERLRPNTVAPASFRPAAIEAPMPREAPVTTAIFPAREKALRSGIAVTAHDGGTELDVFRAVDLEHLVTVHHVKADLAAETIVLFAQE